MTKSPQKICPWCLGSQLYIDYHNDEWGVPCYDSQVLFGLINLEGAQAGLSWITILNKREHYLRVFANFEAKKVARFSDAKIDKLVLDPGIVRHRQKITAVRTNARIYLEMEKNGETFTDFVWSFVNYTPRQNQYKSLAQVPATTDESDALSKALKKQGFKFIGSTICYAFMQACGMVNDHLVSCPGHARVRKQASIMPRPDHWS